MIVSDEFAGVHRHTDGSIDFDFYRTRARAERAAVWADFFKGLSRLLWPAILGRALFAMSGRNVAGTDTPATRAVAAIASAVPSVR